MKRLALWLGVLAALVIVLLTLRPEQAPRRMHLLATTPTSGVTASPPPAAPAEPFVKRPFAVARETGTLQWTSEDGKEATVIRRLAHNDLEYQRLLDENARILRRQLVYRLETAATIVQQAKLTGQEVRQLTLPGLDGHEIQFEILEEDLSPSGQQGTFAGRIFGREDSMVTLAFKGGREAFTVVSPSDNLYLQGDPREPGEVVVKSFDPDKYIAGACGNP